MYTACIIALLGSIRRQGGSTRPDSGLEKRIINQGHRLLKFLPLCCSADRLVRNIIALIGVGMFYKWRILV